MEIVRQKNVASIIVFPLVDADGDPVTSAGSLDSEIDTWSDGAAPDGFTDCTNEAAEIGTTGIYSLSLTATELNVDYAVIQIKSAGAKTQVILIRTIVGDPLNLATTDDGGAINVASGIVEAQVKSIDANAITATSIAADAITAAKIATGAIDADAIAADAITAAKVAADVSQEIADAVWDEDATGHQTQGTFGQAIGDPVADTNTIFKAVVTDAAGATVGVDVVAVKAETASIQADTDDLQTKLGTPSNLGGGATVAANLSDIEAQTDDIGVAGAGLTAVPWNAAWDAEVQSEVVDALNVDTYVEPGQEAPPATTTLVKKIGYLYKFMRNRKTQSATTLSVYGDDATTVDQKATISDNGTTYDHGEVTTGP